MRPLLAVLAATTLAACGDDGYSSANPPPPEQKPGGACTSAAECGPGLVCFQNLCAASLPAASSCAPPGDPRVVLGDPVVAPEPPPGTCVAPVREPVLATGTVQDLGEHPVGASARFEVPPATSSFTIVSQGVAAPEPSTLVFSGFRIPNSVVPTDVVQPDGSLFFDDLAPYPIVRGYDDVTGVLAYHGAASPVSGSFSVPNTSAALDLFLSAGEAPPGTWSFTVNDWARECLEVDGCSGGSTNARYRIHVVNRPGPIAATGTLDLEVYLATDPGGRLPNAAASVADPQTARWVAGLSQIFAGAGICLGTITFRDLPEWARARYAPGGVVDISGGGLGLPPDQVPSGCDDLSQLFTVATAPNGAIHLFLAEELIDATAPGLGTTLGIDGSIPGPSGFPGTVNGGAVAGIFGAFGAETTPGACSAEAPTFACGTDVLAYVAAHEAGHWLGLYHTTEWSGTQFDPLLDTPTCPCDRCAPAAQRDRCTERGTASPLPVASSSCARRGTATCGGAQNLMFWQLDRSLSEGLLTSEQGLVMRLNPAIR